jgi:hypothetical protein
MAEFGDIVRTVQPEGYYQITHKARKPHMRAAVTPEGYLTHPTRASD